jgi:hypothetical protein
VARLTYSAPGVYVEEIPSARQPIFGVGTNTAGFIGLIPDDEVFIPEPNPDYDPMLARAMMNYRQLVRSAGPNDREVARETARLQGEISRLDREIAELQAKLPQAQQDQTSASAQETQMENLPEPASPEERQENRRKLRQARLDRGAADAAVKEIEDAIAAHNSEKDSISRLLNAGAAGPGGGAGGAGAAGGPGAASTGGAAAGSGGAASGTRASAEAWVDHEDSTYDSDRPDDDLTIPSRLRPYTLRPFKVSAENCSTKLCTNFTEYTDKFGWFSGFKDKPENGNDDPMSWVFKPLHPGHHYLTHAVSGFFRNGGTRCFVARIKQLDDLPKVLDQFESIEDVAILAAPGVPKLDKYWEQLEDYCEDDSRPNVFAVLDGPALVNEKGKDEKGTTVEDEKKETGSLDLHRLTYDDPFKCIARPSKHAAFYWPWIEVVDPAKEMQDADPERQVPPKYRGRTHVAPSGHMAGIYARTDEERGVHKAPANAVVRGAIEVKYYISKPKQELLNPHGVNCIRLMDGAVTVWGARTVGGAKNGEWMYVNVRRFAGFLEQSIIDGTQWIVFEPNDPNLWSRIILNVTAFLTNVWRGGALFGLTPQEAFYVKCDAELNPPEVRDLGQVVTEIGVAIVRPAEFVIFRITQFAGQPG